MKSRLYRVCWYIGRSLFWLLFGLKPVNNRLVPKSGPIIVAANHQSYFDPPILAAAVKREMHFFAKKELFGVFFLGWLIRRFNAIPVRRGTYDPSSLSRVSEVLAHDGGLIMFPEGTRGDGKEFLKPKPGIGLIAKRSRVTIVPAYIYRTNRMMGALFGRRRIKVLFGVPISYDEIEQYADDKEGYRSLAGYVMMRIERLKTGLLAHADAGPKTTDSIKSPAACADKVNNASRPERGSTIDWRNTKHG